MKKNFINNTLYFGFKFGKVFAVIALIALLLVMVGSGLYLFKIGNYKISTPQFSTVKQAIEARESSDNYSENSNTISTNAVLKEKAEKKFSKDIEKIIHECDLKPFAYDIILTNIINYDEKYQNEYVKGLLPFISEGLSFVKEKYKKDLNNIEDAKEILKAILTEYNALFTDEINRIEEEQEEQAQNKYTAMIVLLASILLFVICLFLPLLIKIEENTREFLTLNKNKEIENND